MKISVVIATRDRLDDLCLSISNYYNQTYKNIEIIVIDNNSQDGTKNIIPHKYPNIKYIWLPNNIDILAINYAISLASGEIIWRCDDDSFPKDENTFEKVVEIFSKHPEIDIISTENIDIKRGNMPFKWYPLDVDKINVPSDGYKSHMFIGTGAAIKKSVFDKIGYFWTFGFEEIDFCGRAILNGLKIRYFPNIVVLHLASPGGRVKSDRWIVMACQFLRIQWKYFPFYKAFGRTVIVLISELINAVRHLFNPMIIIEGFAAMFVTILKTIRTERQPMNKSQLNDFTLGTSLLKNQYTYFSEKIIGRYNKWTKK